MGQALLCPFYGWGEWDSEEWNSLALNPCCSATDQGAETYSGHRWRLWPRRRVDGFWSSREINEIPLRSLFLAFHFQFSSLFLLSLFFFLASRLLKFLSHSESLLSSQPSDASSPSCSMFSSSSCPLLFNVAKGWREHLATVATGFV